MASALEIWCRFLQIPTVHAYEVSGAAHAWIHAQDIAPATKVVTLYNFQNILA